MSNTWATGFYLQHGEWEHCQALSMAYLLYHAIKKPGMQNNHHIISNTVNWKELFPPHHHHPPKCIHACTHMSKSNVSGWRGRYVGLWGPPRAKHCVMEYNHSPSVEASCDQRAPDHPASLHWGAGECFGNPCIQPCRHSLQMRTAE